MSKKSSKERLNSASASEKTEDLQLTRQQIFNYLHEKRHANKAPYGLIEREEEEFEAMVSK